MSANESGALSQMATFFLLSRVVLKWIGVGLMPRLNTVLVWVAGLGLLLDVANAPKSPTSKNGDALYLRRDPKLHAKITLELRNPTSNELLARLCNATGLTLTLDRTIENYRFDYGHMNFRDVPACGLMELMADRGLDGGYWIRTDGGYRLVGRVRTENGPKGQGSKWRMACLWGLVVVLFVMGDFCFRKRGAVSLFLVQLQRLFRNRSASA